LRNISLRFLAVFFLLILLAWPARGNTVSGSWDNKVTMLPQVSPIDSFSSTLTLDYSAGEVDYSSTPDFSLSGFSDQEFTVDFSFNKPQFVSTLDFDPADNSFDYWLNTTTMSVPKNIELTHKFLLQKTESGNFGSGMEFKISGDIPDTGDLTLTNLFGMEEDSGKESDYAIVTSHGDIEGAYGPSLTQYVSSKLELSGMELGCVSFDSEALLSEANGFEYLDFSFDIYHASLDLTFSSTLKFTPVEKSITLDPSLTMDFACFTIYNEIPDSVSNDTDTNSTITGLEIEGFSLTGIELGEMTFSSYTALGDNTVSDLNGDFDYGDNYDEVFRIKKSDELLLTLDGYFDMTESDGLFDFALLDGTASYDLSDQFTLGAGAELGPAAGLQKLEFSLDYSF